MLPYEVLGKYQPTRARATLIGAALCRFTADRGFVPLKCDPMLRKNERSFWKDNARHANLVRYAHPEYEGVGWHQDGDNTPGSIMDHGIILWSDRSPTEFRWTDCESSVYQPQPLEVIYFRNMSCYHRRPPGLSGKRWLFRQRVV